MPGCSATRAVTARIAVLVSPLDARSMPQPAPCAKRSPYSAASPGLNRVAIGPFLIGHFAGGSYGNPRVRSELRKPMSSLNGR